MTHLVHDRREQIYMARWRSGGIGVPTGGRNCVIEQQVAQQISAEIPAVSATVTINDDPITICFAKISTGKIINLELDGMQGSNLLRSQTCC